MTKLFNQLFKEDSKNLLFTTQSLTQYQNLTLNEKVELLNEFSQQQIKMSLAENHTSQYKIALFYLHECLNHDIENFKTSKTHNELLKYALFFTNNNNEENFKEKKSLIDLLIEKENLNVNKKIEKYYILNLMARLNDVNTIKYLISLGAKTDKVDTEQLNFAASALHYKENLEVFTYAINETNFVPNAGENILNMCISKDYKNSIHAIIYSTNHILSNEEFLTKAKKWNNYKHESYISEKIMPLYEKYLLESKCNQVEKTNQKLKI